MFRCEFGDRRTIRRFAGDDLLFLVLGYGSAELKLGSSKQASYVMLSLEFAKECEFVFGKEQLTRAKSKKLRVSVLAKELEWWKMEDGQVFAMVVEV